MMMMMRMLLLLLVGLMPGAEELATRLDSNYVVRWSSHSLVLCSWRWRVWFGCAIRDDEGGHRILLSLLMRWHNNFRAERATDIHKDLYRGLDRTRIYSTRNRWPFVCVTFTSTRVSLLDGSRIYSLRQECRRMKKDLCIKCFWELTTRHPPTAQTYFYLSMVEGAHKKLLCNTYPQSVIRVVVVVVVAACPGRVGGGGCVKKSCHRVAFSANSFWFITMQFFFAFTFC